tara:strand:- start:4461 stop:5318 length:858 start_codon:yes stop_codon:yes gene_type:complete
MLFFKSNWKAIIFPFFCLSIVVIDQLVLELPLIITIFKIGCFSFLHFFYVLKNKYIYTSDIYQYISNLRIELNKNNIIKPFLKKTHSTYLFWAYFLLIILFISNFSILVGYKQVIFFLIVILTMVVFMDAINELIRLLTNKSELSRVYTPHSLQQTRFVWQALAKLTPVCTSFGKVALTCLVGSEVAYPIIFGNGQSLGPITKTVANQYMYPDCNLPIETRFDMQYESYKSGWNSDVDQNLRPIDSRMPERALNIRSKVDMYNMSLTTDMIDALESEGISISTKK